jgi:hypothetical protein
MNNNVITSSDPIVGLIVDSMGNTVRMSMSEGLWVEMWTKMRTPTDARTKEWGRHEITNLI